MRLRPEPRFTSFYESFSDLIFATMAIFVLLMMVFLTQIGEAVQAQPTPTSPPSPAASVDAVRELEREIMALKRRLLEQLQASRQAQESKASAATQASEEIEQLRAALEPRPIELFIVIDGSGSMGQAMAALRAAVNTMIRVLPEVSPSFHIGIIAYRRNINNIGLDESLRFPDPSNQGVARLFELKPDDEAGRTELLRFTSRIQPVNAYAPVAEAIQEALEAMAEPGPEYAQQTLVVMGDVGPQETQSVSLLEADDVYAQVEQWTQASKRRNVISVFNAETGSDQARTFFDGLADAADQPHNFTDEPDKVLALILRGIIDRSREND